MAAISCNPIFAEYSPGNSISARKKSWVFLLCACLSSDLSMVFSMVDRSARGQKLINLVLDLDLGFVPSDNYFFCEP